MEQLALRETLIQKKIQLLKDELNIIKGEMELVRMNNPEQQEVISLPPSERKKTETIPEQTVFGKESSNPLMPVDLAKIQTEVQTSKTLVRPSDFNLRPNGGIQIPNKTDEKLSAKEIGFKTYYVVYNGPNPGIYTSWATAEKAVTGFSGVKHKKFKTLQEAKVSAGLFTTSMFKPPLELIFSSEGLKPTFAKVLKSIPSSLKNLGTNQQKIFVDNTDDVYDTSYGGFRYLYRKGRISTEKEFVEEKYFTTDKANLSYFNFYPQAHPEFVFETFQYGLLSMVYPSSNLLEISKFPKEFRDAVKTFKKKCLKDQDKEIYLKIQSTNLFWDEDETPIQPYHFVQIGTIKEKVYFPSKSMDIKLEKKDLKEHASRKLMTLIDKVHNIKEKDKIKVNLVTPFLLMTSHSFKGADEEDLRKIKAFQQQLISPHVFQSHDQLFCEKVKKKKLDNNCHICQKKDPTTCKMENVSSLDPSTSQAVVEITIKEAYKEKDSSTTSTSASSTM